MFCLSLYSRLICFISLCSFLLQVAETDAGRPCLDLLEPPRNSEPADGARDPGKLRTKGKGVTFALQKNTVKNTPQDEGTLKYLAIIEQGNMSLFANFARICI